MDVIKACVLMSTYNGEKYINEQIDSLLEQDQIDVTIMVRDDGSQDRTKDMINEYILKGDKILFLEANQNIGPAASFMKLIYDAPAGFDIYLLSDQDDIWFPDKIKCAYEIISRHRDNGIPLLYCSNQYLYIDGKKKNLRFSSEPNHGLISTLFGNHIAGCTMAFNTELLITLKDTKADLDVLKIRMHDTWIMLIANLCGKILYDKEGHMLYRIHDDNTVGISNESIIRRLVLAKNKIADKRFMNGRSKIARVLLDSGIIMDKHEYELLAQISDYKYSFRNKYTVMRNKEILENCPDHQLILCLKLLINWL